MGPDVYWAAIGEVDRYREWWPWLRRFEAAGLEQGAIWKCTVQPPLPYTLRFTVTMDEVVAPELIVATVAGDLAGSARLSISDLAPGCEVRLESELTPTNRYLRVAALFARPVVRFGHDWVLDTGARQFSSRAV